MSFNSSYLLTFAMKFYMSSLAIIVKKEVIKMNQISQLLCVYDIPQYYSMIKLLPPTASNHSYLQPSFKKE